MRRALILLACLLAAGCKEKPAEPPEVDAGAKSAHAASPVEETPTHDTGSIAPTDKPSEDNRAAVADAGGTAVMPPAEPRAEVEVTGSIAGIPKDAAVVIAVSKKACAADDAELDLFGKERVQSLPNFFIEVFVPQGAQGWLCAYALDKDGKLVAFATGDKNPMTMKGMGEVMFEGTKVELKAVKAKAAPKGLQ